MVSVNLIFHVVSALTFVLLIWYLLHMQAQLTFLRTLVSSLTQAQPKVVVDWPQAFLRKFAAAQGLSFVSHVKTEGKAQKIDVRLWAQLHASLGVELIEFHEKSLRLKVRQSESSELEAWRSRLESSLQGKIKIEWI